MSNAMPSAFSSRPASWASEPPLVGEVDVDPAGEQVFEVPDALAVAQQQKSSGAHERRRDGGCNVIATCRLAGQTGKFGAQAGRSRSGPADGRRDRPGTGHQASARPAGAPPAARPTATRSRLPLAGRGCRATTPRRALARRRASAAMRSIARAGSRSCDFVQHALREPAMRLSRAPRAGCRARPRASGPRCRGTRCGCAASRGRIPRRCRSRRGRPRPPSACGRRASSTMSGVHCSAEQAAIRRARVSRHAGREQFGRARVEGRSLDALQPLRLGGVRVHGCPAAAGRPAISMPRSPRCRWISQ